MVANIDCGTLILLTICLYFIKVERFDVCIRRGPSEQVVCGLTNREFKHLKCSKGAAITLVMSYKILLFDLLVEELKER